ncbi:hypothetical protein FIBSPDRAFT_936418 [Athelia psychrophila]|uniref:BTB domain-containing protein n=1 Tax=Athelia psychrophila TaxID=1759441 RepID=A0A166C3K3_9AGAM|nr:hypothetical protein FIBSPDRAFT_936418 [Fibularhizoctonia sp. CBS 109695]
MDQTPQATIEYTTSERFCADDADVTFASSNNVLFKINQSYLKAHSEGFSPPAGTSSSSSDEIVNLTEPAETLDLLFQFAYPQKLPDLRKLKAESLLELAEAAEKYQVFAAMETCNRQMESSYKTHPIQALLYATKHDYPSVANLAAKAAVFLPPISVYEGLVIDSRAVIAWTKYYAQWSSVLELAIAFPSQSPTHNTEHGHYTNLTRIAFATGVHSLQNLDSPFAHWGTSISCSNCRIFGWRPAIQAAIDGLKDYNSFL